MDKEERDPTLTPEFDFLKDAKWLLNHAHDDFLRSRANAKSSFYSAARNLIDEARQKLAVALNLMDAQTESQKR